MISIGSFPTRDYGRADVFIGQYSNGRTAIFLVGASGSEFTGEAIATLTVNIPEAPDLGPGEICAKAWSENERIAEDALKSGMWYDTGKRIPTGFCEAQIWIMANL